MKFLLTALGSYGDVHPIVGIGTALAGRGHDVTVIANPHFKPLIRRANLKHLPIGTTDDYARLTENPDLWRPIRGPRFVMREGFAGGARELYQLVMDNYVAGETVVAAHPIDLASRIAHEKHGILLASLHLAPMAIRSLEAPPRIPCFVGRHARSHWHKRLQFWLIDRWAVDPILSRPINGLRSELGLTPPVKRFLDRWWFSPQLVLGLFPKWFCEPSSDWPPNTLLTGFPLWDEGDHAAPRPEVNRFLEDGDPPIVFVPGSAMRFGKAFFAESVRACVSLGRRGIFLTKYVEQLPSSLPASVRHFDFVPLSHILPRSAALVQHGGIGTTAQGLAAGVPQLVMPRNFDQPDNADRLLRLGVAEVLSMRRYRGDSVAGAIERLTTSATVAAHCRCAAEKCDGAAARSAACDALERLAASRGIGTPAGSDAGPKMV